MNATIKRPSKDTYQDLFSFGGLIAVAALLFLNARYGIGNEDQSLYLSITLRLTMGDSLLTDDWTMIQLSSFLLYLPVKLYLAVFGSTDGIVLFFRYLFIVMQGTTAAVIYALLRNRGIVSVWAALIFFSYVPVTIMAVSYYTMGLVFVEVVALLFLTAKSQSKGRFFIAGICVAGAVLCNPLYALLYFAYSLFVLRSETKKRNGNAKVSFSEVAFQKGTWARLTLGILVMVSLFSLFVLTRADIKNILANLPYIFQDPDYVFAGEGQNVINITQSLLGVARYGYHLVVVFAGVMISLLLDKKRYRHRPLYAGIVSVIFLILMIHILRSSVVSDLWGLYTGATGQNFTMPTLALMLPLTLLGLTCYCLTENKEKGIFVFLWLHGIVYTVFLDITSDFAPWNSMQGLAVSSTGSVLLIKNFADEWRNEREKPYTYKQKKQQRTNHKTHRKVDLPRAFSIVFCMVFALQVFTNLYTIYNFRSVQFAEYLGKSAAEPLDTTITEGPLKGLKTTVFVKNAYTSILRDLDTIKTKKDGPVLITANRPWCYLYLNMPFATYSVNLANWEYASSVRLPQYYQLHPDKVPRYIYISKLAEWTYLEGYIEDGAKQIAESIAASSGCIVNESPVGYIIECTQEYNKELSRY